MSAFDKISASEFADKLARYTPLIESISALKGAKDGQRTLAELDEYRYGEALELFSDKSESGRPMTLDDVKVLVEWKLRHGKFRPTLMKLVSSNDPSLVQETIQQAIETYKSAPPSPGPSSSPGSRASAALKILTTLKGIGPATASLLLAVHFPAEAPFFADEAFLWLCCGGKKDAVIKYNAKEYAQLCEQAGKLVKRLGGGVRAVDVERTAFVLLRDDGEDGKTVVLTTTPARAPPKKQKSAGEKPPPPPPAGKDSEKETVPAKRKATGGSEDSAALRRSKRGRPGS